MRLAKGGVEAFAQFDDYAGPTMLLFNHQSWWDPILTTALVDRFTPDRQVYAPMDRAMVEQFAFMRKLGLFGVDLDDQGAFKAMVHYAGELARTSSNPSFWISPQGQFADVRAPLQLRPGSAAIASRLTKDGAPPRVLCLAIELIFWEDRKPEVLLKAEPCPTPEHSSTSLWQRQMTSTMESAISELAKLAIARDPGAFDIVLGRGASGVNLVYDTILRATGRKPQISRRTPHTEPSS